MLCRFLKVDRYPDCSAQGAVDIGEGKVASFGDLCDESLSVRIPDIQTSHLDFIVLHLCGLLHLLSNSGTCWILFGLAGANVAYEARYYMQFLGKTNFLAAVTPVPLIMFPCFKLI